MSKKYKNKQTADFNANKNKYKILTTIGFYLVFLLIFGGLYLFNVLALMECSLKDMINNPLYVEFAINNTVFILSLIFTVICLILPVIAYFFRRKALLIFAIIYNFILILCSILLSLSMFGIINNMEFITFIDYISFIILLPFFGVIMKGIALLPIVIIPLSLVMSIIFIGLVKKRNGKFNKAFIKKNQNTKTDF